MKLSTFGLGLAVTASSLVGIFSLSQSANAVNIGFENKPFDFNGEWEFTFLYSFGNFQSTFGISTPPNVPFFTETSTSSPLTSSNVTPNPVVYTFTGAESGFYLSTVDNPTIFTPARFLIATGSSDNLPSTVGSTPDLGGLTFASFVNTFAKDGTVVIGVNDAGSSDSDYNDFIVKARPVPVPAIVPGIALAAAFFGSKALKRNKKEASASDSVA